MRRFPSVSNITAHGFELLVKSWLESVSEGLSEFSSVHRERINGLDGEYEIDVSARFIALGGAKFHVLVECKKHKNRIKREMVQVLHKKRESVGATKAILVSTAAFQQGAIKYAAMHDVALIQVVSGAVVYIQNSANSAAREISKDVEPYAGLFYGENPDGRLIFPLAITTESNSELAFYLGTQR